MKGIIGYVHLALIRFEYELLILIATREECVKRADGKRQKNEESSTSSKFYRWEYLPGMCEW